MTRALRLAVIPAILAAGAALSSASSASTQAAPAGFMPGGRTYDAALRTPAEALGHELGARPTRCDQVVSYLREMADGSDRISMEVLGQSVEGRPIVRLVVTSPENHARQLARLHVADGATER